MGGPHPHHPPPHPHKSASEFCFPNACELANEIKSDSQHAVLTNVFRFIVVPMSWPLFLLILVFMKFLGEVFWSILVSLVWDQPVKSSHEIIISDQPVRSSCDINLWDQPVRSTCEIILWDQPVRATCEIILWDQPVRSTCEIVLWDHSMISTCKIILWDLPMR